MYISSLHIVSRECIVGRNFLFFDAAAVKLYFLLSYLDIPTLPYREAAIVTVVVVIVIVIIANNNCTVVCIQYILYSSIVEYVL